MPGNEEASLADLPEARLDSQRRISLVWLIPLVALLAALWLGYRAYIEQGPLVTITFQTAEGLEAGKTRVRFKDVDIGLVEAIDLSPELDRVLVRARLSQPMARFLNDRARFWVVRPRLSQGQVSGLSTLVGGAYIGADLATGEGRRSRFEGLEMPPIVTAAESGAAYTLLTDTLGSLGEGSPVFYRGIEVGRVVAYSLRADQRIAMQVFVRAPHDAAIGEQTRFWNVSGVGLSLDASGLRLDTESLASLLRGGIAFANPDANAPAEQALQGSEFELFDNQQAALADRYDYRETWQLTFDGSVRGLVPGAPVEFRGIPIGEVTGVELSLDIEKRSAELPVTIAIEPARLGQTDAAIGGPGERRRFWDDLVAKGLRAQLKTGNLITAGRYVDFDFYPDEDTRSIDWDGEPPRLPSMPTAFDELTALAAKLARLPLERMSTDLADSLRALRDSTRATNKLLARLDRETTTELNATLAQTRTTLATLEKTLAPNSPLQSEAHRVLRELGNAARSLRIMSDYLERHPEALLRGKGDNQR